MSQQSQCLMIIIDLRQRIVIKLPSQFRQNAYLIIAPFDSFSKNIVFYMSEVVTSEQQIQLVNIVEVVQTNLAKNFTLLLKRLNHHDTIFAQYSLDAHQQKIENSNKVLRLEQQMLDQKNEIGLRLQEVLQKVEGLQAECAALRVHANEGNAGVKLLNEEVFKTQLQFEDKLKAKEEETAEIVRHVKLLALQQNRLNDEVSKKENRAQAERIIKQTQILKDKNNFFESQLKIAHHKIQKMEILNQKAERMQAKKDVEIFKEIQERVRKELKINLGAPLPGTQITMISKGNPLPSSSNHPVAYIDSNDSETQEGVSRDKRKASIFIEDPNSLRGNMQIYLQKWGEKMKSFEVQLKEITENLKILNKNSSKKQFRENKDTNSQGIKDKLNELKPEVVKLWAKVDTIDDRLSFNQRKLEEKMKNINDLTAMIKDNNVSRLQEKVKNMQTETFTSLKEIKAKLETKVNQTDYDKYIRTMDDRIVQINEMIYLKSDKLQVKKALLFLQSKIKEIILVISQDEQNEKDALLTKKQLKCISCDKQLDKFSGVISSPKGNWDGLPFKDHPPEILGRFGMTGFGSLSKKLKKLEGKDLPVLNKRNSNHSFQIN